MELVWGNRDIDVLGGKGGDGGLKGVSLWRCRKLFFFFKQKTAYEI